MMMVREVSPCSILHTASNQNRGKKDFTSFTKFIWLHRFGRGLVRLKLRTVSATVCGRLLSQVHNLHVHQRSC